MAAFNVHTYAQQDVQQEFCKGLRGFMPAVTLHVRVNSGTQVADYEVKGHMVQYSETDAHFQSSQPGGLSLQLPTEPPTETAEFCVISLRAGHQAGNGDLKQQALAMFGPLKGHLTLLSFADWYTQLRDTPAERAGAFLCELGSLLGVTLFPLSDAFAEPPLHADGETHQRLVIVRALVGTFQAIWDLKNSGITAPLSLLASAETLMARLLVFKWRPVRKADAESLTTRVLVHGKRLGPVLEAIERSRMERLGRPLDGLVGQALPRAGGRVYLQVRRYIRGRLRWTRVSVGITREPKARPTGRGGPRRGPSDPLSRPGVAGVETPHSPQAICGTCHRRSRAGRVDVVVPSDRNGASGVFDAPGTVASQACQGLGLPGCAESHGASTVQLWVLGRSVPYVAKTSSHGPCVPRESSWVELCLLPPCRIGADSGVQRTVCAALVRRVDPRGCCWDPRHARGCDENDQAADAPGCDDRRGRHQLDDGRSGREARFVPVGGCETHGQERDAQPRTASGLDCGHATISHRHRGQLRRPHARRLRRTFQDATATHAGHRELGCRVPPVPCADGQLQGPRLFVPATHVGWAASTGDRDGALDPALTEVATQAVACGETPFGPSSTCLVSLLPLLAADPRGPLVEEHLDRAGEADGRTASPARPSGATTLGGRPRGVPVDDAVARRPSRRQTDAVGPCAGAAVNGDPRPHEPARSRPPQAEDAEGALLWRHADGCPLPQVNESRAVDRAAQALAAVKAAARLDPQFPSAMPSGAADAEDYHPEGFMGISMVPMSGGAAQAFAAGGRRCRKLAPATRRTDLPLASTSRNLIDVDALARDGLAEVLAPIRDPRFFEGLFQSDAETRRLRPLSRGMLQHRAALIENDVVEPVCIPLPSGRRRPVAERFLVTTWCGAFLVEKKNGTGRFIVDARPINRAQAAPPDMGLPRIGHVVREVLRHDLAAKTDGVSYFYQFKLASAIRPYFKIRLAGGRGRYAELQLRRMPMGWKYAPMIAQRTSNFLVNGCGVAWLDDFLVLGSTHTFAAHRSCFLGRLRQYNVEVDNTELEGSARLAALGLDFDLCEKKYRLDPSWVSKRVPQLRDYLSAARSPDAAPTSLRRFLEVMGVLIWSTYVREQPLWQYAECLAALSHAAKTRDLEAPFQCPDYCHQNLAAWIDDVDRNEWMSPTDSPVTFNDYVFSDASDTVAAYIKIQREVITHGEAWTLPPEQKIFLSEVEAIARGATQVDPAVTLFGTDNQAAHYAMRKGHSSSYAANVMLRRAFGSTKPWSRWVPTHLQPADRYTRGTKLPELPTPIDGPVIDAIAFVTQRNA